MSEPAAAPRSNAIRALVGGLLLLLALAFAAYAVWAERRQLSAGLHRLPVLAVAGALLCGAGAVVCTLFQWRAVLGGLGAHLDRSDSARVYFVGQLGKYVPGSVWPLLAQMELARRHRVGRKTMLTGGVLAIVVNLAVGAVLACLLLPFVSPSALHRFWWLLACVPLLIVALHPKVVLGTVNWVLTALRRETLVETLSVRAELKAAAWGLLSWALLGAHVYLLVAALGATGPRAIVASVAAGCLAVSVGILAIPVPAGAGVREVAFVLALAAVLSHADGLLVALVSRVLLVAVDVGLAAAFAAPGRPLGKRLGGSRPS